MKDKLTVGRLTGVIAAILLASFLAQWPTQQVADWKLFSFYDPGTILKGDWLLAKGLVPTVDFGYTHGLVGLLYGRVGFALLGRTPWAFLALTLLVELGMAWGLARILVATGMARRWPVLLLVLIGLPMAVMPAYLTLTHPLEGMLILLALAAQAEGAAVRKWGTGGGKAKALVLMTVCLFVKPSMAYVYGFLLVVLIVWEERGRLGRIVWTMLPAAVAMAVMCVLLGMRFGWMPVVRTVLPFTGAKTYATTGFGFFKASGQAFWMPEHLWMYVATPVGIFLVAALACAAGGGLGLGKVLRRPTVGGMTAESMATRRNWELLLTIGFLHTAFLLGFYGWMGSWTYYSYLPVLGLALFGLLVFEKLRMQVRVFVGLTGLMVLSHRELVGRVYDGWFHKTPVATAGPGAEPGLWRYSLDYDQWMQALAEVKDKPAVVMTNGFLFDLPENIEMPAAWFPEPGIPTASEIMRVKRQVADADYVILWNEYGEGVGHPDLSLWGSEEFAPERGEFREVLTTAQAAFTVLRRSGG